MSASRAALLVSLLAAGGCSDELARQSLVEGLRVLAVSAEPPEVSPGALVRVTALWYAPEGSVPRLRWSLCGEPADGSVDRCASDTEETLLDEGEAVDSILFAAPNVARTELVRLVACTATADGACTGLPVVAAKRVVVGAAGQPNANPLLSALEVVPPNAPGGDYAVLATASDGAAEVGPDGAVEELFVSWFATAGELADDRTFGPAPPRFETSWEPPAEGGPVTFWAVLRDGRGGVSWLERTETIPAR